MNSEKLSPEDAAEIMRKKSKYRDLILSGKLAIPYESAAQLLGPDCLYHLYATKSSRAQVKKRRITRRRS
jgi:hypothetical protein